MAITEDGHIAFTAADELGRLVFGGLTEDGTIVFGEAAPPATGTQHLMTMGIG